MKQSLKTKIGIFSACFCAMSFLAFAPIVANVAENFPTISLSLIQMMVTLPSLMFIVFSPLAGKLMQKYAKKTLTLISVGLYFVSGMFAYLFHYNFYLILLGSAIMGCGTGLLMPVLNSLICENFSGAERGAMMGLNATFVAIGGLTFTFTSGQLAQSGWHNSFLVFTLILPALVLAWLFLPGSGSQQNRDGKTTGGFEMNPYVFALFSIGFLYFCLQNAFNTNSSMYVGELALGGTNVAGLVSMMNPLGGIIGGMMFGFVLSRMKKQVETTALILSGVGFLLAGLIPSLFSIMAGGLFVGIAYALFNAAGTFLLSQYLKPENNDYTASIYLAVVNLGAALSPYAVNAGAGLMGSTSLVKFVFCGTLILICAAASYLVARKG